MTSCSMVHWQPNGMARWDDVLSRADAESIHAYIVDEAWKAYEEQTAAAKTKIASSQ
jgi:mono/diheme cytochrome c family protein